MAHYNVIDYKWIFTIKLLPNGMLDRYKACLVAKGFNQQAGIDYAETFSPVIKIAIVRLILGVATIKSWSIQKLDVNNAFLQSNLTDYMSQPPRFVCADQPNHVYRLRKAIYGLKQAPCAWYMELKAYLLSVGFKTSIADTSLFILRHRNDIIYLLVYVDDIIITGTDETFINKIIDALATRFSIKDLGDLSYFLGVEITRTRHGLHLIQRKYILDLLDKTNMVHTKPVATPLATSPKLHLHSGMRLADAMEYRTIIGSLRYLRFTSDSRDQRLHMPSTSCPSLCMLQQMNIGRSLNVSFDISPVWHRMGSSSRPIAP